MARSVMKKRFAEVPNVSKPRTTFDRSFGVTTTLDAGKLVVLAVDEIYPGETVRCNLTGFARLTTPSVPIMDNMFFDTHWFFAPTWMLWDNFKKMMGEQATPASSIDYTIPQNVVNNAANESLADYMGIPTQVAADLSVNALLFRMYWMVYNNWYRDQNLQDSITVSTGDGPDTTSVELTTDVLSRNKRFDYFTSCLPFLQKGDAIELALGTEAPIFGDGVAFDGDNDNLNFPQVRNSAGTLKGLFTNQTRLYGASTADGTGELKVDLSSATASTVNELRLAIAMQRLLELSARGGTRYPEIVLSEFGVTPPSLPHRPEFLGGGSSSINIQAVAETAAGSAGTLGAVGTVGFSGHGFTKSFTDHGYLMCIGSVRSDLRYQEGLERFWSRLTRYDFYHPIFANLGEMAVLNKEIYVDAADIGDGTVDEVFGYQEPWADLRFKPSKITGKMRSNDANTLDVWHLGIEFGDTPTLDSDFIKENPPLDRCVLAPTEPHFKFDGYFQYYHTRVLPMYSIPSLVARF